LRASRLRWKPTASGWSVSTTTFAGANSLRARGQAISRGGAAQRRSVKPEGARVRLNRRPTPVEGRSRKTRRVRDTPASLREQGRLARELAPRAANRLVSETLIKMAESCERRAAEIERGHGIRPCAT
jgi:hypothetical protein